MLFNSVEYIFAFLPASLFGFFLIAARFGQRAALAWLVAASLFFYGWWNPTYLTLIIAMIAINYGIATALQSPTGKDRDFRRRQAALAGVAINLLILGYFKYAGFALQNVNLLFDTGFSAGQIVLPLGISFFTFQMIAFLVDVRRGEYRERSFLRYCVFVLFFPQLIAGPIVHPREVLPQFRNRRIYQFSRQNLAVGTTIFAIGLFKKAVIADGIAPFANVVFDGAAAGARPDFFEAWGGALAYTFQLYFDFSGYSDMAIGAARLFGIRLPLNFHSPYKALSIIDFWRRWHMTLSRFLRDYVYIGLGGARKGKARRYGNLFVTMLLGGLWHGAAWTFVAWGALHGFYLVVNHAWRYVRARLPVGPVGGAERLAGWLVTFLAVVVGWVLFRATSFESAVAILWGMAGGNGIALPAGIMARLGGLGPMLQEAGIAGRLGGGTQFISTWSWCLALAVLAFLAPNTQELLRRYRPALLDDRMERMGAGWLGALVWRPVPQWAFYSGALLLASLLALSRVSEFLYFQF
ncbi:MAG: MBOAT family protein [Alphaproteobacteria bacterium]|nr:MBOAT family protein [Alphaproteobacteria bacterium]